MMTRLPFLFVLLFGSSGLLGQITLTEPDFPNIGDDIFYFTDTLPSGIDIGMAGTDQTWDFSGLNSTVPSVSSFIDPAEGVNSDDFPSATVAQVSGVVTAYLEVDAEAAFLLGAAGDLFATGEEVSILYDPPATFAEFPLTYNTSYLDTFVLDFTFSSPDLMFDSVRIKQVSREEKTIDGWGTAELPGGTYDCLREKTITTQIDSSWVYFFGQSFLTTDSVESTSYAWLSDASKGLLVSVELDTNGVDVISATYFDSLSFVAAAPQAAFSAEDQGSGLIAFTDESSNVPTEWLWDFGDGNTSTQQNPVHVYDAPGTYTVCLTVTNSAGSDTVCEAVEVDILPIALFSFENMGDGEIAFTDESTGAPTSWSWDFGDGNTSADQNPSHTYNEPGEYTVCLTVSNSSGSDEVCETLVIILAPVALFSFESQGGGTYQFTDESLNDPTSWSWDFADGNSSTEQNPEHTFSVVGTYEVCLEVMNAVGSSQACGDVIVMTASQEDLSSLVSLQVFPNPTSAMVFFQTDVSLSDNLKLRMLDGEGRELLITPLQPQTAVDMSAWPAGTYLYQVIDGNMVLGKGQVQKR